MAACSAASVFCVDPSGKSSIPYSGIYFVRHVRNSSVQSSRNTASSAKVAQTPEEEMMRAVVVAVQTSIAAQVV